MPSLYTTSDRTKLTCVFVSGAKTTAQAELRPNIIEMFLDSYKTNQTHRYTKALMTFSSWFFPHMCMHRFLLLSIWILKFQRAYLLLLLPFD